MYKNVKHYRHTVHLYLDAIWSIGKNSKSARTAMYNWLATQMELDPEFCHVRWFTREQCRQAIKILRPKYIQLYGHDLPWRKENTMEDIPEEVEELSHSLAGSYWNYRWLKIEVESPKYDENLNDTGETEIEHYYELHEVYYDKDEKPFMWTENPSRLQIEDCNELMEFIHKCLDAATRPVLLLHDDTITELNEYMDKSEVLEKWQKKNQ